jgi:hypothetical protein
MKRLGNWFALSVVVAVFAASCAEPPQYSVIPAIEYDNVIFKDVADPSLQDSLIITVRFKDGDGNLGLDATETGIPYNDKFYFTFSDGSYITYKTKRTNPHYDTLPAFVKPYNCINWEVKTVNAKIDTFYYQSNPNTHNIFVQYYVKNADGSFTEFEWTKQFGYPFCATSFDGRFPILSKDLSQIIPLEGTIRYGMVSTGFLVLFSIKTLKLKVTIVDRALNRSNTVETPEFTLQSIKKSG